MIPTVLDVLGAGLVAGIATLGVFGLARAMAPPAVLAFVRARPAPVPLLDLPPIDPIAAVQELEDRMARHVGQRRAVVDLGGGLLMSVQRSILLDADSAWPTYALRIGDYEQDLATWEEVVEVAEARLRAVAARRAVRGGA